MRTRMTRRSVVAALGAFGALEVGALGGRGALAEPAGLEGDAFAAWLYVLPLIEMAGARARLTQRPLSGQAVPNNVVVHAPGLAGTQSRAITTPNRDTIYSSAFIDLANGPVTMRLPETGHRYFSVAVLDMYTNAGVVVGTRTTAGAAGTYRLIGPHEKARDDHDLRLGTPHGWLTVRTLPDSDADLAGAQRIQKAFTLSGPMTWTTQTYATRASSWTQYFRSAQSLLESDPPTFKAGYDAFDRLRRAARSGDFDRAAYSAEDARAIDAGVARALALVQAAGRDRNLVDGWSYPRADLGDYGDDFGYRAVVAVTGLGALPLKEAMYIRAAGDDGTGLFRGDGLYRLSLGKPIPGRGFWSLTMYEATPDGQFFFAPNALGRYAIGDRTAGLVRKSNGGLDIWIGRRDPGGERRANWLPAPASGPFALTLRAYLPDRELLDGSYRLPAITPQTD